VKKCRKILFCEPIQIRSNFKAAEHASAVSFVENNPFIGLSASRAFDVFPNGHTVIIYSLLLFIIFYNLP